MVRRFDIHPLSNLHQSWTLYTLQARMKNITTKKTHASDHDWGLEALPATVARARTSPWRAAVVDASRSFAKSASAAAAGHTCLPDWY